MVKKKAKTRVTKAAAKKKVVEKTTVSSAASTACIFTEPAGVWEKVNAHGGGASRMIRVDELTFESQRNLGRSSQGPRQEEEDRLAEYLRTAKAPELPILVVSHVYDALGEVIPDRYMGVDGHTRNGSLRLTNYSAVSVIVLNDRLPSAELAFLQASLNSLNGGAEATAHNITVAARWLASMPHKTAVAIQEAAQGIGVTVDVLKAFLSITKLRDVLYASTPSSILAGVSNADLAVLRKVGGVQVLSVLLMETDKARMPMPEKIVVMKRAKQEPDDEAKIRCIRKVTDHWYKTHTFHTGSAADVAVAEKMVVDSQRLARSLDKLGVRDAADLSIGTEERERIAAALHRLDLVLACWRVPQSTTGGTL